MPLQAPTRRLMHHVGLEFVAKKVSGGGHRSINASLSLTSMIDLKRKEEKKTKKTRSREKKEKWKIKKNNMN